MKITYLPLLAIVVAAGCQPKDNNANGQPEGMKPAPGPAAAANKAVADAGKAVNDALLTAKVKTVLSATKAIPAAKINVNSRVGVVTLTGDVPNMQVAMMAAMAAKKVEGVTSVVNKLTVAGKPMPNNMGGNAGKMKGM